MENYYIVIPDIHLQYDRIISIVRSSLVQDAEKVIFLGDYFDSFDYGHEIPKICNFLNANVDNPDWIFLIGNHDVHYFSHNNIYRCSGWNEKSQIIIDYNLKFDPTNQMKFIHHERISGQDVIFSHAGLHPSLAPLNLDADPESAISAINAKINMYSPGENPYIAAGRDRGGTSLVGGLTWMDFYSFEPITGIHQIVGHSTFRNPSWNNIEGSKNVCIDTNLNHILKINLETNAWTVYDTKLFI